MNLNQAQLVAALRCEAVAAGLPALAALHLVLATGCDLVSLHQAGAIEVVEKVAPEGGLNLHARIVNWPEIIYKAPRGSAENLIKMAASYTGDSSVALSKTGQGLHLQHARAVAEAALICAGAAPALYVAATDKAPDALRLVAHSGVFGLMEVNK